MQDKIHNWHQQIDTSTRKFREQFEELSVAEINRKPNAGTWSVAENIQHLISVNESYFPVIKDAKEGKYKVPFTGRFPFFVNFMGNALLKSVEPTRRKKIKTLMVWEPANATMDEGVLQKFEQHHQELKKVITESEELIKAKTVISSPANKNIVYYLDKAFDIMVAHEQRHLNQAKEAMEFVFDNQYHFDI